MSTQKAKIQLFNALTDLGFTYDEAVQLRRIEMTLQRWAEAVCNGDIQRDEVSNKPYRRYGNYIQANDPRSIHFIADREAGALKRLAAICKARNARQPGDDVIPYHQGDCRGCMVYLCTQSQLRGAPIDQAYNRGLAVCA